MLQRSSMGERRSRFDLFELTAQAAPVAEWEPGAVLSHGRLTDGGGRCTLDSTCALRPASAVWRGCAEMARS